MSLILSLTDHREALTLAFLECFSMLNDHREALTLAFLECLAMLNGVMS